MFIFTIFSLAILAPYTTSSIAFGTLRIPADPGPQEMHRIGCIGQNVEIEYDYASVISSVPNRQQALRSEYTIMHNDKELYRANFNNKTTVKLYFSTQNFTAGNHVFACKVPFPSQHRWRNNTYFTTLSLYRCTLGQHSRYKKLEETSLSLYCPDIAFGAPTYWTLDGLILSNYRGEINMYWLSHMDVGTYQCYDRNENNRTAVVHTYEVFVLFSPSPVGQIKVVNYTDTTAMLTWDRQKRNKNKVDVEVVVSWRVLYDIRYAPVLIQSDQAWRNLQSELNSVTLTGIEPQKIYLVQVRARNEIKNKTSEWEKRLLFRQGDESEMGTVKVGLTTKYGETVRMMCAADLSSAPNATVEWSKEVSYKRNPEGSYVIHVVTEYEAGIWKCSVKAKQNISSSTFVVEYSQVLTLTVLNQPPGLQTVAAPIDVQCKDETLNSIKVVWKGDPLNSWAAKYRIRYKSVMEHMRQSNGRPKQVEISASAGAQSVVLQNLAVNMKYSVEVVAVDENGFEGGSVKKYCVTGVVNDEW